MSLVLLADCHAGPVHLMPAHQREPFKGCSLCLRARERAEQDGCVCAMDRGNRKPSVFSFLEL